MPTAPEHREHRLRVQAARLPPSRRPSQPGTLTSEAREASVELRGNSPGRVHQGSGRAEVTAGRIVLCQSLQGELATRLPPPGGSRGPGHSSAWTREAGPAPSPRLCLIPKAVTPPEGASLHPWTRDVITEARGISGLVAATGLLTRPGWQPPHPARGGGLDHGAVPSAKLAAGAAAPRRCPRTDAPGTVRTRGGPRDHAHPRGSCNPGLPAAWLPARAPSRFSVHRGVVLPADLGDPRSHVPPLTPRCPFLYSGCHPDCEPRLGAGLLHPPPFGAAAPGWQRLRPDGEKGTCHEVKPPEHTGSSRSLPRRKAGVQMTQGSRDTPNPPRGLLRMCAPALTQGAALGRG